jgi:D-alanine-D-alanine ligase
MSRVQGGDRMQKINIGIVYGGRSVEHEVSIISALQAAHVLDKHKYQIIPLYITKQGEWYTGEDLLKIDNYQDLTTLLPKCTKVYFSPNYQEGLVFALESSGLFKKPLRERIDVVLPVIHGTHGEDGCLQGLLELSGVPYVGSAVLGSACGMDKIVMKALLKENNLPTPDYDWFYLHQWEQKQEEIITGLTERIGYPMIVKPSNLGSSIGVSLVENQVELLEAIALAGSFTKRILVEKCIQPLREINCSVLGSPERQELSVCEEPSVEGLLDFKQKYFSGGGKSKGMASVKRRIPADISQEVENIIKDYARRTFVALDEYGVCRIDFLLNADTEEVFVNEINTIPGSLAFYLWEPIGKSYRQLIDDLISLALDRARQNSKLIFSYDSNILAQGGFKGGKK